MRNGTAIVRHKKWIGLEACHIATLTQRQHSHALLHTYSFSLSLSHMYILTLSNLISANCYRAGEGCLNSLRPSAAQQFSPRCHFIHFYSAFISTFSAVTNPLRTHAFTTSQVTYVAFPSALPPLPSRNAFRKSVNTNENGTYSILYIESVLCVWKYEYLLNICNKFVYINLVF